MFAIWRIFQVILQLENNSSNWLGLELLRLWMLQIDGFFKWSGNFEIIRQIDLVLFWNFIHFDFLLTGWWYQHWLVPTHVVDFYWRRPKILYCCTRAIQGIMIIITIIETTCQVQEHITVGLGLSSIKAEKLSAKRNVSASNVRRILTLVSHVSPFFS